ncbi:GspH/FimT family pseudopilin [Candidatus Electronema sp. JM]|uniref:GspH/FimT family pseudopilin n=1 Tax=Candidatus Electronema sp. JM TaxID=3401571 RepID=UPI003AA8DAC7
MLTTEDLGFSFVELMVVIALISALSAIGLPSFLSGLPEQRLKSAARTLYADMQRARLLAVKNNAESRVKFVTSAQPGYYYFDDNDNKKWDAGEFKRELAEYSGVNYGRGKVVKRWDKENFTALATNITFGKTGTANPGTTYLDDQNHDVCYAVTTTTYGMVKIRRFNGVSWDNDGTNP